MEVTHGILIVVPMTVYKESLSKLVQKDSPHKVKLSDDF